LLTRHCATAGLIAVLSGHPGRAAAQGTKATVVFEHASVRAKVPSLGPGWYYGSFAHARTSKGDCLGVGLKLPQAPKEPVLVLLMGLKVLEVDRRTNSDVYAMGLDAPADSDWQVVDLPAVIKADTACGMKAP
jgi:hypothetical protein